MSSETEICNRALQKLGDESIGAFGDTDSKAARECLKAFAPLRKSELRKYPWSFAINMQALAASSVAPVWKWDTAFPLPDDFERLLEIEDLGANEYQMGQHEGVKAIFCDLASTAACNIRYVADVDEVPLWDSAFTEAFVAKLAMELGEVLTASSSKVELARTHYETAIREAKASNAIEQPPEDFPEDDWNEARR